MRDNLRIMQDSTLCSSAASTADTNSLYDPRVEQAARLVDAARVELYVTHTLSEKTLTELAAQREAIEYLSDALAGMIGGKAVQQ